MFAVFRDTVADRFLKKEYSGLKAGVRGIIGATVWH